jgi:hypothetical protein
MRPSVPERRTLTLKTPGTDGHRTVREDEYPRVVIGDERRVVEAFASWLREQGWTVTAEVQFVDLYAERHGERRFVEAKGRTTAPGLDVDTMYGQLLRRVTEESPSVRYYVVVPSSAVRAALRVPRWVRDRLAIDVYGVSDAGEVSGPHAG